jgi:hypothetical protein
MMLVEVALDEHEIGNGDARRAVEWAPELVGGGLDGGAPRVRVDRADRQPVPGGHYLDPRVPGPPPRTI